MVNACGGQVINGVVYHFRVSPIQLQTCSFLSSQVYNWRDIFSS